MEKSKDSKKSKKKLDIRVSQMKKYIIMAEVLGKPKGLK